MSLFNLLKERSDWAGLGGARKPRLECGIVAGILTIATLPGIIRAQATPAAGSAAAKSPGFSIESEMLTYRALDSNGEAVACDVAGYLTGTAATFTGPSASPVCSVKVAPGTRTGLVLLPLDQNVIAGFQLWRADMEIMSELRNRSAKACPEVHARGLTGAAASVAAALTPAGTALGIAQGVVGMLASQADTSTVVGTIEDQAFMNGVARQLRVLGVSVLLPTAYHPYALNGLDPENSPFLANLDRFLASHDCMEGQDQSNKANKAILDEMDTFLSTLNGSAPASSKPAAATAPAPSSSVSSATTATPAPVQSTVPQSSLTLVLMADGLARKLGVDPLNGTLAEHGDWQHILFVKALESGGAVQKLSNLFGTKIRYTGGSVGTYTLVDLTGELECSGNVFDFGGAAEADLHKFTFDPSSQVVFQRGSCRPPAKP